MTTYEAIKLLIEQEVDMDFEGKHIGHEGVAEHLAERIDSYVAEIDLLKAKIAKLEKQVSDASWAAEYRRGMNF